MRSENFLSRGLRNVVSCALSLLLVCGGASYTSAQEAAAQDEVVKVRTRVVFLDSGAEAMAALPPEEPAKRRSRHRRQ